MTRVLADRPRRIRAQHGYSLMEVLVALAVFVMISVPLTAWVTLAIGQQPRTEDGLVRTAATGLLASSFPRDVAVAGRAAIAGEGLDESWAADCGAGAADKGSVQLVLVTGGADVRKIVYTVADYSDGGSRDPSRKSLWRRTCSAGADSTVTDEQELYAGVRPGSTTVTCTSEPGDDPCRQIELETTPTGSEATPIYVRATRRLDKDAVPTDLSGVPLPTARIDLVSRQGSQAMTATFSGQRSSAAAGRSIASYRWEFEAARGVTSDSTTASQVTASFPTEGSYTVLLTVTDDGGGTNTQWFQISSSNQAPVAVVAAITPNPANAGTTVTLSSAGSYDPDGSVARIDWMLNVPTAGGGAPVDVPLSGASPTWVAPSGVSGVVGVTLTITDTQLGRSTAFSSFTIFDPAAPPSTTSSTVPTDPGGPGALVAQFSDVPGPTTASRTFDAGATTGAGTGATYSWILGDGATASGVAVTHTYPNSGEYVVRLTVVASDGRTDSTERTVNVGGAPPAPGDVRAVGADLVWTAVPGASRYLASFEFTGPGCAQVILDQVVAASPNPTKAIPASPCAGATSARAQVATDANGSATWSAWVAIPPDAGGA